MSAWQEMTQLGWGGVIIPEEYDGSNLGCYSLGILLEETGRTLTASPLLVSSLGAASALILGGSEAQKTKWLPKIATGDAIITLAIDEGPRHTPSNVSVTAEITGKGYRINGKKHFVMEGLSADAFIVSARTGEANNSTDNIELFIVDADIPGIELTRLSTVDSRGVTNIEFNNVEVSESDRLEGGYELLEQTLDRLRAGLCAEMLGAASEAFETTIEYLKTRVQFGVPIGSFQALQHRAARMLTELELSRSAVEAALIGIDNSADNVPELVSIAKAKMGDTLHLISLEMIQMHGGIGMTDEHDAGFYLKRARVAEALFGNQAFHRDRYAKLKGY